MKARWLSVLKRKYVYFTDLSNDEFETYLNDNFCPRKYLKSHRVENDIGKYDKSMRLWTLILEVLCPLNAGFPINVATLNYDLPYSLHGWFPKNLSQPLTPLPVDRFLRELDYKIFSLPFLDSVTFKPSLGCGQYHEYHKHGAKSGLTLSDWLQKINSCSSLKYPYPHQCSYNGTHKLVLSLSSSDLGLVGCKPNSTFVTSCSTTIPNHILSALPNET